MYQVLLCTCRAILLIKAFVLPRSRCRCRRGLLKVPIIFLYRTKILTLALGISKWRHLCFSRSTSQDDYYVFVNGALHIKGGPLKRNGRVGGSGTKFYLGQAWDKPKRRFLQEHSYVGSINDVNMWNEMFSEVRVRQLFLTCGLEDGNAVAWSALWAAAPSSLVSSSPSKCPVRRG